MNKYIVGSIIVITAIILGVVAAFGISKTINNQSLTGNRWGFMMPFSSKMGNYSGSFYPNMMGGLYGTNGMMSGNNRKISGERISIDEAIKQVTVYISSMSASSNLKIAEIMEFENNFYVPIIEQDTGKAAFEVLVDPYTGYVYPEYGPNMMWNNKYSHMGNRALTENKNTLEQARSYAQKVIDVQIPSAEVETNGLNFYGYYTFDFKFNNLIAGMLSVNGLNGQVWLHTWHGQFITEKEIN